MTTQTIAEVFTTQWNAKLGDMHFCCCRDERTALCGLDLTKHVFGHRDEAVTCVRCVELDETENICPFTQTRCYV